MSHQFIEPHPSVPLHLSSPYLSSGRGGAGNFAKYARASLTHGPEARGPARAVLPPTSLSPSGRTPSISSSTSTGSNNNNKPRTHITGRGGAGNVRPIDERRVFDFEDELRREQSRVERTGSIASSAGVRAGGVVHVGRGGAGNVVSEGVGVGRQGSLASSRGSFASASSGGSEGGWRSRLSRVLTRE